MATAHATLRRRSGQAGLARVIADIRREVAATALLAAACIALGATAAAQDPRREHRTFEDAAAGAPPPGFSSALTGRGGPAHWVVLEDPSSPTGAKVVAETSQDRTSDRFPLAILDGFEARDVAVLVRFRPVSGTVDQAAGLVVRLRDSRNYYVARANALEGNVRLYRVVDGRRTQFAGVDVPVPRDRWQTLGLRVEGDRLEVALEGRALFAATNRTFRDAGRVGLWTKADSLTHFDALEVEALR
jgi:hypothetical protein